MASSEAGQLRGVCHVVLLTWSVPAVEQERVAEAIRRIATVIPQIIELHAGPDVGSEQLAGGFDFGFTMTFASLADLSSYQNHPAHLEVSAAIRAATRQVLVFDIPA